MIDYQLKLFAASAAMTILAAGCSFSIGGESVDEAAVKLIEEDFAADIGVDLVANCPAVEDSEVGTTFECSATMPDGRTINFAGKVDAKDSINMRSTNLLKPEDLDAIETSGAEVLEPEIEASLVIECPAVITLLDEDNEVTCRGEDEFGNRADIIFTITDTETGAFTVRVG